MNYLLTLLAAQARVVLDSVDLYVAIAQGNMAQIDSVMAPWGREVPSSQALTFAALRAHYFPELEEGELAKLPDSAPFSDILSIKERLEKLSGSSVSVPLTMSEAFSLVKALDYYSRVGMGQIHTMTDILGLLERYKERPDDLFRATKCRYLPELGGGSYHGIHSPKLPLPYKTAWDIQQVVRHRASWDRDPRGGITVNFDTPLSATNLPFPTIEKVSAAANATY